MAMLVLSSTKSFLLEKSIWPSNQITYTKRGTSEIGSQMSLVRGNHGGPGNCIRELVVGVELHEGVSCSVN